MITQSDLKSIRDRISSNLDVSRQALLSGKPADIEGGQAIADLYLEAALQWRTLNYINQIKRWIAQTDTATHKIKFIEDLVKTAIPDGRNSTDWRVLSRTARVMRYAGRFRLASRRYRKSLDLIARIEDLPAADRPDAADAFADYAELLTYLGYPEQAEDILDRIPDSAVKAWHSWVRAFALHQRGFARRQPFGTANPDDKPGDRKWYEDSIDILQRIEPDLPHEEAQDMHLLLAADWGALFRLGIDPANSRRRAEDALAVFFRRPENSDWSWEKERRGRFLKRIIYPGEGVPELVKAWRKAYRNHYHENLKVPLNPELPARGKVDGEVDDDDDHPDDGGD